MRNKTIVVVFHMNLYPVYHGNQARVFELIRGLRLLGYKIVLEINQNSHGITPKGRELKNTLAQMKKLCDVLVPLDGEVFDGTLDSFNVKPYADAVEKAVLKYKPLAVIAEYIWMAPCLDKAKDAIKLIDTHDLMYVRKKKYSKVNVGPWVICTKAEETRLLNKADVIISIQNNEKKIFKKMVPKKKVICILHFPGLISRVKNKSVSKDIIMVIGSRNPSNTYSIKKFLRESWPLIKKECPKAKLYVYGKLATKIPGSFKGVKKIGFVKNIETAYKNSKLVINPTLIGTGLKIKTVEALRYGKALVTTKSGADGLESGIGRAFIVEDNMAKFGKHVVSLLKDDLARKALEKKAFEFAKKNFSLEAVFKELVGVLEK